MYMRIAFVLLFIAGCAPKMIIGPREPFTMKYATTQRQAFRDIPRLCAKLGFDVRTVDTANGIITTYDRDVSGGQSSVSFLFSSDSTIEVRVFATGTYGNLRGERALAPTSSPIVTSLAAYAIRAGFKIAIRFPAQYHHIFYDNGNSIVGEIQFDGSGGRVIRRLGSIEWEVLRTDNVKKWVKPGDYINSDMLGNETF